MSSRALFALAVFGALSCGSPSTPPAGRCDGVRCAGTDVCNPDNGLCEGRDGGPAFDAGHDAGSDAGLDGGLDAGLDGGGDAGLDAGTDAGVDAGCQSAFDCVSPTPACRLLTGQCVECTQDGDCFGANGRCDPSTFRCVECLSDSDCPGGAAPRCEPVQHRCFGCLANPDCTGTTPVCDATHQCMPCNTPQECGAGRTCDFIGSCSALPDSCANPRVFTFPSDTGTVSLGVQPALGLDNYLNGCGVGGPELVYGFTTTTVRDLTVSLAPAAGSTARPSLSLRQGACPGAEVGCDAPDAGAASLAVTGLAAGSYFVFAGTEGTSQGPLGLTITLRAPATPPGNDSCAAPQALSFSGASAVAVGDTLNALDNTADAGAPSCSAAAASGPDVVYSYTTTARSNVTATVRPLAGSSLHPVLSARSQCAPAAAELACAASALGEPVQLSFPGQAAGTYFLWVDSAGGTSGAFELDLLAAPVVDNDTCSTPQALTFVGAVATAVGDTTWASNGNGSADPSPSCSPSAKSSGRDEVFQYTLTAASDVALSVTPTGAAPSFAPVLEVRSSSCSATALANELACVNPASASPATAVLLAQPAGTYFVWVDGANDTAGPFQLEVTASAPTPPPPNDNCSAPRVLTFTAGQAQVSGSTQLAANDNNPGDVTPSCSSLAKQNGRDVVYAVDVPALSDVSLTVAPVTGSQLRPVVYVRKSSCTSQLLSDELYCVEQVGTVSTTLTQVPAGRYYLWVDGTAGTSGAFTLTVSFSAPTVPPANDDCPGQALAFDGGVATVVASTFGASNSNSSIDLAPTCGANFYPRKFGRDLVYQYTLATPRDVDIRVGPSGGLVPAVYVRAPGQCTSFSPGYELGCVAQTASAPLELYLPNQAAGTYSLFVDSVSPAVGPFTLEVGLLSPTPPPANDSCGAPAVLSAGPGLTGDTTGATDDYAFATYSTACHQSFLSGRDVVYQYTAPGTGTVTATVTPRGSFNPALLLLTGSCSPASCARMSDSAGPGGAEAITFDVQSGVTYYLVVDAQDIALPDMAGAFTLTIQ